MGFDPEAKMHGAVTARFPSYSGIEITSILAKFTAGPSRCIFIEKFLHSTLNLLLYNNISE